MQNSNGKAIQRASSPIPMIKNRAYGDVHDSKWWLHIRGHNDTMTQFF